MYRVAISGSIRGANSDPLGETHLVKFTTLKRGVSVRDMVMSGAVSMGAFATYATRSVRSDEQE